MEKFDLENKIMESTAIADAIGSIALFIQAIDTKKELTKEAADVIFGIRKLAEMLGDELNEVSYELVRKGGEVA